MSTTLDSKRSRNEQMSETYQDVEFRLIRFLTRRLPRVKGAGVIANKLIDFYRRRPRPRMVNFVQGFEMELDPHECVDAGLLFYPQLYDYREIAFLKSTLKNGDIFVDVGAHIGFYSFMAARQVGPQGRILAIEADPVSFGKLSRHIERNGVSHIISVNQGVSDIKGSLPLWINSSGNRGGNTFLPRESIGLSAVQVECHPLYDLLKEFHISHVDGMKLDIEGFEYRVLKKFLREAPRDCYPGFIIIEHNPCWMEEAGGNAIDLLKSAGYQIQRRTKYNYIMMQH